MDKQEILKGIKENAGAFIYYHYDELADDQRKMILLCALNELKHFKGSKFYNDFIASLELYLREERDVYDSEEN